MENQGAIFAAGLLVLIGVIASLLVSYGIKGGAASKGRKRAIEKADEARKRRVDRIIPDESLSRDERRRRLRNLPGGTDDP